MLEDVEEDISAQESREAAFVVGEVDGEVVEESKDYPHGNVFCAREFICY